MPEENLSDQRHQIHTENSNADKNTLENTARDGNNAINGEIKNRVNITEEGIKGSGNAADDALRGGKNAAGGVAEGNKNVIYEVAEGTTGGVDDVIKGGSTTEHMLGSNGTQVSSKTTWRKGTTERIDVENPAPGERPGQIHYHDANNNKYYYDINSNAFYDPKTGDLASNSIQKLLHDEKFMEGIKKALRILGK